MAALRRAIDENNELRKQAEEYMKERVRALASSMVEKAETIDGHKTIVMTGLYVPEVVKNVAFLVRQISPENTVFIAATMDMTGKPLITVALTEDVVKAGLNASAMAREAAKAIKGGGGGQPGFAQAGGKDKDGISAALEILRKSI